MPKRRDTALTQLFERLGYAFKNRSLLELALTHASARPSLKPNEDNERLEFLGDRVLGLAIAELLTASFPEASEGELARRFNQLVRAETCAEVAHDWELGKLILMSGGEAESGGREQEDHPRQCLRGGARRHLHRRRLRGRARRRASLLGRRAERLRPRHP